MSNVNSIQKAIMELEGGAFQKLFDAYLYKKYKFENIQTLGVQTGTNKPTKGTPDSYVLLESGEYILINYGSVSAQPASKIRDDILSCFNIAKLNIDKSKIKKIICGYCSTNIHLEQFNSLMEQLEGIEIKLIGIDTISHDLALIYPNLAYDYLHIEIDSHQIFDIDDFVTVYDANGINAPIDCEFHYRENEVNDVVSIVKDNKVSVIIGASGVGKTRLVLESCRTLEKEGWNVLCVRSNGALLYNDLRYYFTEKGRYILFLDDANTVSSFENVLDYLMTISNGIELKVIITLRDYAKERVVDSIIKYTKPALYLLNTIKDDEIKGILKANFGIINELYLKKISEIACGNIRLAVLAGLKSVENGYEAINNAEDIFKVYYGSVIESSNITREELIILFFVALLGPIRKNDNQLYRELVGRYLPKIDENTLYEHLFSLELIDWFKNEIIKISDQSFSNYILYYVLFEKRWIDLSSIISTGLRDYRQKIIYALNTLMELFKSEELTKYIEDNINDAWNNSCDKDELLYVESFHAVNSVKALLILKKYVDNSEITEFDLRKFDINKHKNNHRISTKEIEILVGYKYTEYLEEALELLLRFFEKQPDKIMDVYFVIVDGIMFDKYSYANKYKNESLILNKLWEKCEMGKDYNFTLLYINVAEQALKTEKTFTEEIKNSRSVNFVRMSIPFSDDIKEIRTSIWKNFACLSNNSMYEQRINQILTELHVNGLDEENTKKYIASDVDAIYKLFLENREVDFKRAKIYAKYEDTEKHLEMPFDERLFHSSDNYQYRIYDVLSREHIKGQTYQEDEKARKESIKGELQYYNLGNYKSFFSACNEIESLIDKNDIWQLSRGIEIVFEIVQTSELEYIDVFKLYMENGAPFSMNGYSIVAYLLKNYDYTTVMNVLDEYPFDDSCRWMNCVWECLEENQIAKDIAHQYELFLVKALPEKRIIPTAYMLSKYVKYNPEVLKIVIARLKEDKEMVSRFLSGIFREDDVELLVKLFSQNMDELSEIYINALNNHLDFEGNLFFELYEYNPNIWNNFIDWLKDNYDRNSYAHSIVDRIWKIPNYEKNIEYAYKQLIGDIVWSFNAEPAKLLFGKVDDEILYARKRGWLLDRLYANINDIEECKVLINIVTVVYPDWEIEYLLEYLKLNKNCDDFKKLYLFPLSESWSGSQIPLINNKIDLLQSLNKQIFGLDYLEHKAYIEERIKGLEEYRDKVEIREYLENVSYA